MGETTSAFGRGGQHTRAGWPCLQGDLWLLPPTLKAADQLLSLVRAAVAVPAATLAARARLQRAHEVGYAHPRARVHVRVHARHLQRHGHDRCPSKMRNEVELPTLKEDCGRSQEFRAGRYCLTVDRCTCRRSAVPGQPWTRLGGRGGGQSKAARRSGENKNNEFDLRPCALRRCRRPAASHDSDCV